MINVRLKYIRILLATASALSPALAHAQAQSAADVSASSSTDLGDIVVTAQRREQRLNDVGLSANVLTGKELAATGTKQLTDLGSLTTNVQIKNVLANSITNVSIRGIGLNDYAVNNNPAAGVYVDNVYLVSPAMLSFGLFDVDRVEVLKGPQGDLYGRNTTAGAVNIISRKPSATPEVAMEVGYGSYQNWHFDGAAGGALTSTLNARFALQTIQQNSGWQTNYVTGKRIGKIDRTAGRLQLEWKPVEDLSILLNGHAGYDRSDAALYKPDQNTATNEDDLRAGQPRVSGASNDPHMDLKSRGASVTVNWSIEPRLTLTSITAYEHFTRQQIEDEDGSSLVQLDANFRNNIRQASQELRLAYSAENLELIGGAFYSRDTVRTRDEYGITDLLPSLGNIVGNRYKQRTTSYAGFVHGEWTFLPQLTLIGGLRWTREKKNFDGATTFFGPTNNLTDVYAPQSRDFSTSKVSGKVGLNYKLADQTLLYASVSRGFKSGGFQGQLTFDPTVLTAFQDEKLTAYEIGLKSRVASNLQINAAVFQYEYRDAQFYGPIFFTPGIGVLFGIANVGNSRVQGAEADITWRPMPGLDLHAGAGYVDSKITKSIVAGVAKGSVLPNAPKLTLNGSAKYTWSLSDSTTADIMLNGSYQSRVKYDIVLNPPQAVEGGYFLANGEIGANLGEHFRVAVFGKNLFNRLYKSQAFFTSVGFTYFYGPPRTVGINLSYKL
jgi:iron complex outermembrane receptor protein